MMPAEEQLFQQLRDTCACRDCRREARLRAEGYARAVADVVAWLRSVGAGYEVETPIEPRVPFGDPMYRGVTVKYFDAADEIEHGAHVGAAGER